MPEVNPRFDNHTVAPPSHGDWVAPQPATLAVAVAVADDAAADPRPAPPPTQPCTVRSVSVLSPARRVAYWAVGLLWLVLLVRFWEWWLRSEHVGAIGLYVVTSACLAYLTTVLPSFFWFFVGHMRRPEHIPAPEGWRVALITLCVPSHETNAVIEGQLAALAKVRYPHDSWLLDEGGDPAVKALAERYGVCYFTRNGVPEWNESEPPFQARTKAGNVNAWLDHLESAGIEYEAFVQLDIDHRPRPEYLDRTLGYLRDESVAWVQAPSVAANLACWPARGLAEQDLVLQGPLQMGFYGHSATPFIIGSHTTYRTSAILDIGGFQPTRAEDHLDTVVLASEGYRGVYVPELIAEGEGPADFGTYLGQQFAWAYSMVQIFLQHMPRLIFRYTPGQVFQFLMAQSWYPLYSLSLAVLWLLPVIALLSGKPIAHVSLLEFLAYQWGVILGGLLMWWWCRRWFQPPGVGLSWRGVLLEAARWPIVLWALVNVLLGIKRPYMITPKGDRAGRPPRAFRLYAPYVLLASLGAGAAALSMTVVDPGETAGYVLLVLLNSAVFVVLLVATLALELRDLLRRTGHVREVLAARAAFICLLALVLAGTGTTIGMAWAPLMEAFR